jgi:hypothetical protein
MKTNAPFRLLVSLFIFLSACSGGITQEELTSADEVGFGVQDVWFYDRIIHVNGEGNPVDITQLILSSVKLDLSQTVDLLSGYTFAPISNMPSKVVDGANDSLSKREFITLTPGIIEKSGERYFVVISSADQSQEQGNIDFDDFNMFDFSKIEGLEQVKVGDRLLMDLLFAQTLRSANSATEEGLTPAELFALRVENGLLQMSGQEDENGQLVPLIYQGIEAEIVEGSTYVKVVSKVSFTVSFVASVAALTAPSGPFVFVTSLAAVIVSPIAATIINIEDAKEDKTPPAFYVEEIKKDCNLEEGYGYLDVRFISFDFPFNNEWGTDKKGIIENVSGIDPNTVTNKLLFPPEGVTWEGEKRDTNLSNSWFVVNEATFKNFNNKEQTVRIEMYAQDIKGQINKIVKKLIVPGKEDCTSFVDISGLVWEETQVDGIRQNVEYGDSINEALVSGIEVHLYRQGQQSVPEATTYTDENGRYEFLNFPRGGDGFYIKFFIDDETYFFTNKDSVSTAVFDERDSDVFTTGPQEGETERFNLYLWPKANKIWGADAGLVKLDPPIVVLPTPEEIGMACPSTIEVFVSIFDDLGGHAEYIVMPETFSLTIECGSIIISGPPPWVNVIGDIDSDGNFTATGSGIVAGHVDIDAELVGVLFNNTLDAKYSMGVNGGLPGSQSIIYSVQGKVGETSEGNEVIEEMLVSIGEFVQLLEVYNQTSLPEKLLERLHPSIIETYGKEACLVHVANVADPTLNIEIQTVNTMKTWSFMLDDKAFSIADVYTVDAIITRNNESNLSQTHFGVVENILYWFTDCGDPLK